jgi:hypothetical protein
MRTQIFTLFILSLLISLTTQNTFTSFSGPLDITFPKNSLPKLTLEDDILFITKLTVEKHGPGAFITINDDFEAEMGWWYIELVDYLKTWEEGHIDINLKSGMTMSFDINAKRVAKSVFEADGKIIAVSFPEGAYPMLTTESDEVAFTQIKANLDPEHYQGIRGAVYVKFYTQNGIEKFGFYGDKAYTKFINFILNGWKGEISYMNKMITFKLSNDIDEKAIDLQKRIIREYFTGEIGGKLNFLEEFKNKNLFYINVKSMGN